MALADADLALTRRIANANLPAANPLKTFENFQALDGTEQALEYSRAFCEPDSLVKVLTLVGAKGCGKSHLLEAVGRQMVMESAVMYALCADVLDRLRASYDDTRENFHDVWYRYANVDVLILDDLGGMDKQTAWGVGKLASLIDDRYRNGKRLVVGTNLSMKEVARQFDERVADRLWDDHPESIAHVATLTCSSYRTGETW